MNTESTSHQCYGMLTAYASTASPAPDNWLTFPTLAFQVASFGHLLDSNLHLALQSHNFEPEVNAELDRTITHYVTQAGGAVSAELGCGFRNRSVICMIMNMINYFFT